MTFVMFIDDIDQVMKQLAADTVSSLFYSIKKSKMETSTH